jgi:Flp pilus assembly protein protease CpaA
MHANTLLNLVCVLVVLVVSYTDIRYRRIPNVVTYPAILSALFVAALCQNLSSAFWGAMTGGLVLVIPVLLYGPGKAGVGDVKLAVFIGLCLGFPSIFYALLAASISAGLLALAGLALHRLDRHATFPFAPFLAFGAILALVLSSLS